MLTNLIELGKVCDSYNNEDRNNPFSKHLKNARVTVAQTARKGSFVYFHGFFSFRESATNIGQRPRNDTETLQ